MIQLSKNYGLPERAEEFIPIKIVSVGGAGLNALDRIVLDGLEGAEVLAVNTDVQSLASSVAAHKVQLGRTVTRGLGAGGDPEVGYQAAFESTEEIREALTGGRMIFICTGLGGGTGSGGAAQRDCQRSSLLRKRSDGRHGRPARRHSSGIFQGRYDYQSEYSFDCESH